MRRFLVAKVALTSILLILGPSVFSQVLTDKPRRIDDIGLAILDGIVSYEGTQASFDEHFFPGELGKGLPLAEALKLPDVGDPMAWQANYSVDGGAFGEGWQCTQYGLQTLAEIDVRASNGTPTVWRDTLLREGQSQGYVAKLNCEFRVLDIAYRDADKDQLLEGLQSVFTDVSITSARKGGGQYTQYVINARALVGDSSLGQPRLGFIINDQEDIEDNVRGRLVMLVRASSK